MGKGSDDEGLGLGGFRDQSSGHTATAPLTALNSPTCLKIPEGNAPILVYGIGAFPIKEWNQVLVLF